MGNTTLFLKGGSCSVMEGPPVRYLWLMGRWCGQWRKGDTCCDCVGSCPLILLKQSPSPLIKSQKTVLCSSQMLAFPDPGMSCHDNFHIWDLHSGYFLCLHWRINLWCSVLKFYPFSETLHPFSSNAFRTVSIQPCLQHVLHCLSSSPSKPPVTQPPGILCPHSNLLESLGSGNSLSLGLGLLIYHMSSN